MIKLSILSITILNNDSNNQYRINMHSSKTKQTKMGSIKYVSILLLLNLLPSSETNFFVNAYTKNNNHHHEETDTSKIFSLDGEDDSVIKINAETYLRHQ